MLTIKHDENLLLAARQEGVTPEELIESITFLADLGDDDIDHYAGDLLGELIEDHPERWKSFPGDDPIPYIPSIFDNLRLRLCGAENPCPECGWETFERYEDHMIACPLCGWSKPMFLSEQNDE